MRLVGRNIQSEAATSARNVDEREMIDVIVIGAGPAGVVAALRRGPGRSHGAGHSRRVRRHGGQ